MNPFQHSRSFLLLTSLKHVKIFLLVKVRMLILVLGPLLRNIHHYPNPRPYIVQHAIPLVLGVHVIFVYP